MAKTEINSTVQEFNGETREVIIRNLTVDEIAQRQLDATENALFESVVQAKVIARESALAKLAELGLTEEEIAAL